MLHQMQINFEKFGTEIMYHYTIYIYILHFGFLSPCITASPGIAQNLELATGFTFVGCCQASEGYMQLCSWKRYKDLARVMPVCRSRASK